MAQWKRVDWFLFLVLVGILVAPFRPAHRAVRTVGRWLPLVAAEEVLCSENFKLLYSGELEEGRAVLELLEAGLADLQAWLPDFTPKPIVVRLHPTQAALQQALGGSYAPTLGAYYLGKLELLAPQAWQPHLNLDEAIAFYAQQGPVVHELTHLLLDYQVAVSYPVWFSEGMAQYWEERLRGYVWQEGGLAWREAPHSLDQLTDHFSSLPEAIAYQEALSLVSFLYERMGDGGVNQLLTALGRGQTFTVALQAAYGQPLTTFEQDWKAWLMDN